MDREILGQYMDMKAEIADLEELIQKTKRAITNLEGKSIQVSDSVKGTRKDGTYGSIRITGYPYQDAERYKQLMKRREERLGGYRDRLLEMTNRVDDYINSLEDSRMRRILRYKYFDGLSWVQVAYRMGRKCTADSCRKQVERFLEEK